MFVQKCPQFLPLQQGWVHLDDVVKVLGIGTTGSKPGLVHESAENAHPAKNGTPRTRAFLDLVLRGRVLHSPFEAEGVSSVLEATDEKGDLPRASSTGGLGSAG